MKDSVRVIYAAVMLSVAAIVPGCRSSVPRAEEMALNEPMQFQVLTPKGPALPTAVEGGTAPTAKDASPSIRLVRGFAGNPQEGRLPLVIRSDLSIPANVVASVPKKSVLVLKGTTFGYMWMSYKIELRQDGSSIKATVDQGILSQGPEKRRILSVTYDDFIRIWYAVQLNPPDSFGWGDLEMNYVTMDGEQVKKRVSVSGSFTYLLEILQPSPGYEPSLDIGGFKDEPERDCEYETFKTWLFDKTAIVK